MHPQPTEATYYIAMGLVEELLDSTIDPSYSVGSPNDEADPDEEFSWAFSLLDKIELAPDGNYELEQMDQIIGEKQKDPGPGGEEDEETDSLDLETEYAETAVTKAQEVWRITFKPVRQAHFVGM